MVRRFHALLTALFLLCGTAARAAEPPKPTPLVKLSQSMEEGKKQLVATVTLGGKPIENVAVTFRVKRTFGNLPLGTDTTLDDGTAAVAFPANLPGDAKGRILVIADTQANARCAAGHAEESVAGAAVPRDRSFPRALWAPHGPITLILVVFLLFGSVWLSYLYVAVQVWKIRKGASREQA